jgi:uncharacterized protein YkwD
MNTMKLLFILLTLSFSVNAADRKMQAKVSQYFNILRQCPDTSAVPAQILKELEKAADEALTPLIISGLKKEYQWRGTALIQLCRQQSYLHSKKYLADNKDAIKAEMAVLQKIEKLSEENNGKVYDKLKVLVGHFIPAEVAWSEKVKTTRKILAKISSTISKIDASVGMADFDTLAFIAKASACPLIAKKPAVIANYKRLSSIPFQISAAAYQINLIRVLRKKATLLIDPKLNLVAFYHAKDMKENNYLSHESPTEGLKTLKDRATRIKTQAAEEIIGRGTDDVIKLNWAYLKRYKNARHYFGPWTRIGVGFYLKHWTQVFGK